MQKQKTKKREINCDIKSALMLKNVENIMQKSCPCVDKHFKKYCTEDPFVEQFWCNFVIYPLKSKSHVSLPLWVSVPYTAPNWASFITAKLFLRGMLSSIIVRYPGLTTFIRKSTQPCSLERKTKSLYMRRRYTPIGKIQYFTRPLNDH